MRPMKFTGYEVVLGAPKGWDDTAFGPCDGLPIRRDERGSCISVWKLTWRERLAIFLGANIMLDVHSGPTQPPVALRTTRSPEVS